MLAFRFTAHLRWNRWMNTLPRHSRLRLKPDGTRWRTGGEVKEKLVNGVGSQYSHATSERGVTSITTADAHTTAASSRLNCRPRQLKWTRPFRRKTKSCFCACAITFQTHYTTWYRSVLCIIITLAYRLYYIWLLMKIKISSHKD